MSVEASSDTDASTPTASPAKVKVHFVPVGSAPILKKNRFQIGADQRFASVHTFLRKMLRLQASDSSLFLYLSSAFCPSPDELIGELDECFSKRGELIVHYSLQEAWG
jgi:ubiquitin-like protein ATG12